MEQYSLTKPPQSKFIDYFKVLFIVAWIIVFVGTMMLDLPIVVRVSAVVIYTIITFISFWVRSLDIACIERGEGEIPLCNLWGKLVAIVTTLSVMFMSFQYITRYSDRMNSQNGENDWRRELLITNKPARVSKPKTTKRKSPK